MSDTTDISHVRVRPRKHWFLKALAGNAAVLCLAAAVVQLMELERPTGRAQVRPVGLRLTGALAETITRDRIRCEGSTTPEGDRNLYRASVLSGENIRLSMSVAVGRDGFEATLTDWTGEPRLYRALSGEGVAVDSGLVAFAGVSFRSVEAPRSAVVTVTGEYACSGLLSQL